MQWLAKRLETSKVSGVVTRGGVGSQIGFRIDIKGVMP